MSASRQPLRLRILFRRQRASLLLPVALAATATALADDASPGPAVNIYGQREQDPVISAPVTSGATVYQLDTQSILLLGGPGAANPYTALQSLPSVNAPGVDSWGMANVPGGNKDLRIRGESNPHGAIGTLDGVPLSGIDPGPGAEWLFDMENIRSLTLAEGPIAPDRTALFTTVGALDSELMWPMDKPALNASLTLGSHDLRRTFMRADSGDIAGSGTAIFVSASDTRGDKWRGTGEAPDGRTNAQFAIESRPIDRLDLRFTTVYGHVKQDNYAPLTYAQASNLAVYGSYDFSPTIGMNPANYQGYNRQDFTQWAMLGEIRYAFNDSVRLVVKPFYMHEKGWYLDAMSSSSGMSGGSTSMPGMGGTSSPATPAAMFRDWSVDHANYGVTSELDARVAATDLSFGYWLDNLQVPGPPNTWSMYMPNANGQLEFSAWTILGRQTTANRFNSLYALASHDFSGLHVQLGLRYQWETFAGIDEYNTSGVGPVSYEQALAQSSGVIAMRSVQGFTVGEPLPFLAMDYALAPDVVLKLAAGRNFGAPSLDLWPMYQMNAAAFMAKNISAESLWRAVRPETATSVDLGLHVGDQHSYIEPTVFYSGNQHKDVSYDPGIGTAYPQNVANTRSYGAQIAGSLAVQQHLDLFATASYDHNTFRGDLPVMAGAAPLHVDGLQLPDTPVWLASAGVQWHMAGFEVSPRLRFSGSRYGDTQHTQPIGAYTVADLDMGYRHGFGNSTLFVGVSVENLFDRRYVAFINSSYYQIASSGGAIYYPGAPLTVAGKIALSF